MISQSHVILGAVEAALLICDAIDRLRRAEGDSVTILCNNPDFNGQPNCAIECCGEWTGWENRRFTGPTMRACLQSAVEARFGEITGA